MPALADAGWLHEAGGEAGVFRGDPNHTETAQMIAYYPNAIRLATATDADALARLAELDSQRPLAGSVILAEEHGLPVAARSLDDGRVVADPFRRTDPAQAALRVRARALGAAARTPALGDRMRAAFGSVRRAAAAS
jgi:hypothetical protein